MIFKVYYQETKREVPTRERTKALYAEGNTDQEVRSRLENTTNFNIEYIQPLQGAHLEYEKQNENFKVMEI